MYLKYCECWIYSEYWGPIAIVGLASYWSRVGKSSTFLSPNLFPIVHPCDSWRRFRSHWIKANLQFAYPKNVNRWLSAVNGCARWFGSTICVGPGGNLFSWWRKYLQSSYLAVHLYICSSLAYILAGHQKFYIPELVATPTKFLPASRTATALVVLFLYLSYYSWHIH